MGSGNAVSIHVGASRVATDLIESMSSNLIDFLVERSTRIVPRQEYARNLRSVINQTGNSMLDQATANSGLERDLQQFDRFSHIVISQHAMLGNTTDIFAKRALLPKAKRRLENFAKIFADRQINIHLAIAPLNDCLVSVVADDENAWKPDDDAVPIHPWANLVSRIVAACPNARLIVWDFDNPDAVSLPFLAALLGLEVDYVDFVTRAKLDIGACSQLKRAKVLSKIFVTNEPLQAMMDEQYELDLLNIEAMENVVLVRSGSEAV